MKELLVEAILHQQYYIDVDAFDWGFNETTNIAEVHLSWKVFYWKAGAAAEWERKRREKTMTKKSNISGGGLALQQCYSPYCQYRT